MASTVHPRGPSRSQRSTRKKCSYFELTSDEEFSDTSPIQSRITTVRSSKRVQRRSYKEDDDTTTGTSEVSQSASDSHLPLQLPSSNAQKRPTRAPPRPSQRTALPHRPKMQASLKSATSTRDFGSFKHVMLNNTKTGAAEQVLQEQAAVNKTVPPWQDLEYQILLQIFKYAAYPLYIGATHARPTIQWLLDVSLLSKSFRAAAVAALLYSPPIFPAKRAHGLLRLLKHDQDALSTNYRTKIREINVEAKNLLMKKSGFVLQNLVGHFTPLLSVLNVYHSFDLIRHSTWGRSSTSRYTWSYPSDLFDALDDANIHLQGFSWNGRFPETRQVLESMPSLHRRPCLHSLYSLSLLNMKMPEKRSGVETDGLLTTALLHLPELKELSFENYELLNEAVLAKLPHTLRRLSLTTCPNVTSHGLGKFLQLHGRELRGLHLRGNQAMDLGYLPALDSSCPNLQIIEVDLTYTDPSSYHDIDPHYDELLPNGRPTWPASLRVVEFANLRNLDAAGADSFFQSLVDSAPKLKDLRKLSLKAILKIGWRDRARLREKWKVKLENVFLRTSLPPRPFERSPLVPSPKALSSDRVTNSVLESCAVGSHLASVGEHSGSADNPLCATAKSRQSARIAQKKLGSLIPPDVEEGLLASSRRRRSIVDDPALSDQDDEIFIHGMVDEVVLRLDDQRPADAQFNEGDFLDSEQSDEDWDGT